MSRLLLFLLLSGCTIPASPGGKTGSVSVTNPAMPVAPVDTATAVAGNNRFGTDLYREISRAPGNLMISPMSLYGAFGPVVAGARGETATGMMEALRLPGTSEALPQALGGLLGSLERSEEGTTLRIANGLWIQQGFAVAPSFLRTARDDYSATVEQVDFIRAPTQVATRINRWVSDRTATRIPTLVGPDAIDDTTRLIVTNAVYFLDDWQQPFEAGATARQPFRLANGRTMPVEMMGQQSGFRYLAEQGIQAIDLPYRDPRLSMTVILPPDPASMAKLERGLTAAWLTDLFGRLDQAASQEVQLNLPKFAMTADYQLANPLTALGMGLAFSDQADLRGIADADLRIANVIHKTFLRVDEKGTEAAAATAVTIRVTSGPAVAPPVFRADRPFVFVIRDHDTGTIVFLGRVDQPDA